ncbi:hypothetical protein FALBO_16616 [Fusarium albosuccineum]|uniref:Uncharacterized protein n=1 Tax=Fusarium albosuccineum TaxID=1237068 RepID=A0A8H4KGD2_9HYPO|nr:hypothetical protein FALBO_16616 [Fusarium albosuccineum]
MADPEYIARVACIRQEQEREEAEKRQRREERRQQNELRRAHMTPKERAADAEDEKRRRAKHKRRKAIRGLDPVEMALNREHLNPDMEAAVLGADPVLARPNCISAIAEWP